MGWSEQKRELRDDLGVGSSSGKGSGKIFGAVGGRGHRGGAAPGQDGVRRRESDVLQEGRAPNHSGLGHGTCVPTASLSGEDAVNVQEMLLLPPPFFLFKK